MYWLVAHKSVSSVPNANSLAQKSTKKPHSVIRLYTVQTVHHRTNLIIPPPPRLTTRISGISLVSICEKLIA